MGPTTTLIFPASCFPPPKLFGLLSFSFREKMETRRIFAHMSAIKEKRIAIYIPLVSCRGPLGNHFRAAQDERMMNY